VVVNRFLGAAAVTGEPDVAAQAVAGQRVPLGLAELGLLGRGHQVEQVYLADVA